MEALMHPPPPPPITDSSKKTMSNGVKLLSFGNHTVPFFFQDWIYHIYNCSHPIVYWWISADLWHQQKQFYQVYQMYKNGYKVINPKKKRMHIRSQLKTNIAVGWMRVYFKIIREKMPNSISTNLPCYLTNEKVYLEIKTDLEESGDPCCGFSWFSHIWKEWFSNVHIPAVSILLPLLHNYWCSTLATVSGTTISGLDTLQTHDFSLWYNLWVNFSVLLVAFSFSSLFSLRIYRWSTYSIRVLPKLYHKCVPVFLPKLVWEKRNLMSLLFNFASILETRISELA